MIAKSKAAVGYIRMSTDKQEDSPGQQRKEIEKLASREGYRIIRWYEDHGISGAKTFKRREFRRMIVDAEKLADFRAILCWDQDRFGRFDSIEAGEWISPLRRAGVELVTVSQGRIDWDDFAGRLVYQITQEGKHRFLVDLSRNSLRGMIRYAKKGHLLGMPTPYGYDRVYFDASGAEMCRIPRTERFQKPRDWTAQLVPAACQAEIDVVRWIFETFATTDQSARSLALNLNGRKIASPNGKRWEWKHIKNILRNPIYVGSLCYGRRSTGLYHQVGPDGELAGKSASGSRGGRRAPIVVEGTHEPLVTRECFDAAQKKLKSRARVRGGPFRQYLLSGILQCGHCGRTMVGASGGKSTPRKTKYTYYKCNQANNSGGCKFYSARAEFVEQELIQIFKDLWRSDEGQESLRQAIEELSKNWPNKQLGEVNELRAAILKLDQQIEKGSENLLLLDRADIPAASARLAKWRIERDELALELDSLSHRTPKCFDSDAVLAELDELENHLTGDSIPLAKAAFERVFDEVKLFWHQRSPGRRELARAEIKTCLPFRLTGNTSTRRRKRPPKKHAYETIPRPWPRNTPGKGRTGNSSSANAPANLP